MMGKCIASGYTHTEITVCRGCFHKDVCGDKDYLTRNACPNCLNLGRTPDELSADLARLRELDERLNAEAVKVFYPSGRVAEMDERR